MMEEDKHSWLFSTPLATLLLCGAAAVFMLGYLPESRKARECEELVKKARSRIDALYREEARAKQRIAELEADDPEAVGEAIREVLRQGKPSDFLPQED